MSGKWRTLVLLCALLLGTACGRKAPGDSGSAIVARVGDRSITKSWFEDRLAHADRRQLPDTLDLAGKRRFLQTLIDEQVMARKADELQYGSEPATRATLKGFEEDLLLEQAINEACKGKLDFGAQAIDDFGSRLPQRALAKHILVKTRREAEDLYRQLQAGANFDSLAERHSIVPRTDRNGDELPLMQRIMFGEVQFAASRPEVERAVFDTKAGGVSEPVWTGYGWHLFMPVQISGARPGTVAPEMRRRIELQLQARERRRIAEEWRESLLKQHGFQLDEEALVQAYDKLPPDAAQAPEDDVRPLISFTREELARQLFKLDGKKHTLGDFSSQYDGTAWAKRPRMSQGSLGLRNWIRDQWLRSLQIERARKDGIDKLPAVRDGLQRRRDMLIAQQLHENMIAGQVPEPNDAQLREFYDKHQSVYAEKEQRRCNLIVNPQEQVVRRAYDQIRNGSEFVHTALQVMNKSSPEFVQTPFFERGMPQFAEIAGRAFALKSKEFTEPFSTSQGWVVLQVDFILPGQQASFEEAHDQVVEGFKMQWQKDKREELLAQWKKDVKIEIHDDVLARAEVNRPDVFVPGAAARPGGPS